MKKNGKTKDQDVIVTQEELKELVELEKEKRLNYATPSETESLRVRKWNPESLRYILKRSRGFSLLVIAFANFSVQWAKMFSRHCRRGELI